MPDVSRTVFWGIGGGPIATSSAVQDIIDSAVRTASYTIAHGPVRIVGLLSANVTLPAYWEHVGLLRGWFHDRQLYRVEILHGFNEESPDLHEARAMLASADVLFMPGGNIEQALAYWERTGLDVLITAALERGVTVIGHADGLIAWGQWMNTDSESYGKTEQESWSYELSPALGVLPVSLCPHAADDARERTHNLREYSPDTTRRDVFTRQLHDAQTSGIAVDPDTAIRVEGDVVSVLGTGDVTTHRWDGSGLKHKLYGWGDVFSLSDLTRSVNV